MRTFGQLLTLLLLLTAVPDNHAEGSPPRLRVLAYNIHHAEGTDNVTDYERLAKVIRDLHPDIVALQEVDRRTGRSQGIDQAAKLANLTDLAHSFGAAMPYDGGDYGLAILSRYPIQSSKTRVLPYRIGLEPRAMHQAQIELPHGMPVITLAAILATGRPVALATKGTVRLARGFTSRT